MFDLSNAGPQNDGSSVIPNGTFALVEVAVKMPKPDMVSGIHPMVTAGRTGSQYIELELTVVGTVDSATGQLTPKFAKKKIWDKIGLESGPEAKQRAAANGKDPDAWKKAGQALWAAILQGAWNINPKDMAQHASRFTNIGPDTLQGVVVPIKVGVDNPKPNNANPNPKPQNRIAMAVTPDMKEYAVMMAGRGGQSAPAAGGQGFGPAPTQGQPGNGFGGQPQQPSQPNLNGGQPHQPAMGGWGN